MKVSDLELMLWSDGELPPERARAVRVARLHRSDVSSRLEGIEQVGAFVRAWAGVEGVDPRAERRELLRASRHRRTVGALALALSAVFSAPWGNEVTLGTDPLVAIEAVDFGARVGSVFLVEAGTSATPVVWLADDARVGG